MLSLTVPYTINKLTKNFLSKLLNNKILLDDQEPIPIKIQKL